MEDYTLQDWQLGNNSSLSPLTRVELMNDWLKKNKQDILVTKKLEEPEMEIKGFTDLDWK
jgi:hypothetical protein